MKEDEILYDELKLGADAKNFIDHPTYQYVIAEMEKGIFERWRTCPIEDADGQLKLRLLIKLFDDFKYIIRTIAETGTMAEIQLTDKKKKFGLFKKN